MSAPGVRLPDGTFVGEDPTVREAVERAAAARTALWSFKFRRDREEALRLEAERWDYSGC